MVDGIRHPLRERVRILAVGGTYDYLKSEPVPPGEIWVITRHSFENETGARGTARCYVEGHGYEHWLWEQTSPAAGTLYWALENEMLFPGERLCVRQASCTADDEMQLLFSGYRCFLYGN